MSDVEKLCDRLLALGRTIEAKFSRVIDLEQSLGKRGWQQLQEAIELAYKISGKKKTDGDDS
jgi:hypothetical protein